MVNAQWWALLGAVWLMASGPLWGCNTPVYQNAMDNRQAAPYLLFVCRDGAAPKQGEQGNAEHVNPETGLITKDGKGPAPNLARFVLDLSRTDDPLRQQVEEALGQKVEEMLAAGPDPRVLILWPIAYGRRNGVFWSGPLKDLDLHRLTDSPVRRELARQLLQKRVVVWLFVPSGEKAEDTKVEGVLRESLKKLEQEIELPVTEDGPAPDQEAKAPPVPAKPKFGLVRLVPDLPEEQSVARMLRIQELWKEKKVPLAFAVCGRGRVIAVLAGEEIAPDAISEVCAFAYGPCSCGSDPGYDLLMTVDWAAGLEKGSDIEKALAPRTAQKAPPSTAKAVTEPQTAPADAGVVAPTMTNTP